MSPLGHTCHHRRLLYHRRMVGSFDIGALDVMSQVGVFRYILSLQSNERTKLPEDDLELWRRLDNEKAKQIEMGTTQEFLI